MLRGAVIAIGALLPGISGGALCVVMGIYKPMMALLADPIHEIRKRFSFFWPVVVGGILGALLSAKALGGLLEAAETAALFLFIGLIVGTLPGLLSEARQQGAPRGSWAALFIALAAMLAWMTPMSLTGQSQVEPGFVWWCVCGVLWGLGIIVPGLSPSNIFFFLGLAEPMYAAIGALDFGTILPMGLFLAATVLGLSHVVNACLRRFYPYFMHAVVGVVIASTVVILPPVKLLIEPGYTFAMGFGDILIYIACFAAGAVGAWALGRVQKPEA